MLSGVWAWGAHVVRCVWAGLMLSGVCVGGGPCCQVGGGWGRGRGKDLLMGWGGSPVFILAELGHNPQTVEHLPPPPPLDMRAPASLPLPLPDSRAPASPPLPLPVLAIAHDPGGQESTYCLRLPPPPRPYQAMAEYYDVAHLNHEHLMSTLMAGSHFNNSLHMTKYEALGEFYIDW